MSLYFGYQRVKGDIMFEIIPVFTMLTVAALFFMFASLANILAEPFIKTNQEL